MQQKQRAALALKVHTEEFGVAARSVQHCNGSISWGRHHLTKPPNKTSSFLSAVQNRYVKETGGGMVIVRKVLNSQRKTNLINAEEKNPNKP